MKKQVVLRATVEAEDLDGDPMLAGELGPSVQEAVRYALAYGQGEGFVHPMSERIGLEVKCVELLAVTK